MKRLLPAVAVWVLVMPAGRAAGESAAQLYEAGKYAQAEKIYADAARMAEAQAAGQARSLAEALLGLGRAVSPRHCLDSGAL